MLTVRQGYIARGGQILDASVVPVLRNHNMRDESAAIKTYEAPEDWADKPVRRVQKDVGACWTKNTARAILATKAMPTWIAGAGCRFQKFFSISRHRICEINANTEKQFAMFSRQLSVR